jgi:hypothetical protein
VLSLSKLAGADQRYYLDLAHGRVDHTASVASGAEDYYLSGPEGAAWWTGSATRALNPRRRREGGSSRHREQADEARPRSAQRSLRLPSLRNHRLLLLAPYAM